MTTETLTQPTENVADMFGGSTENLEKQTEQMAVFIATEDAELDALESQLKERKAKLDEAKTKLAEIMIQNGQKSIKFENGLSPSASIKRKYFKVAGVDDDQLFDWLKSKKLGDIIKPTVNFNTMQSTLTAFEESGNEIPVEIFQITDTPTVRMNGKSKFLANKLMEKAVA